MPITKTTNQSWLKRIGGSIKGIICGLLMILCAIALLFWNEQRAVKTANSLKEGSKNVVSISADVYDKKNDEKLVHLSGKSYTDDILVDDLGFSKKAIILTRKVMVYQWHEKESSETKKKLGGGTETVTEYSYKKDWSNELIDSSKFVKSEDYQNPTVKEINNFEINAKNVFLGKFMLSDSLIKQITNKQIVNFEKNDPLIASISAKLNQQAVIHKDSIFVGDNSLKPVIGNLLIEYSTIQPSEISIIAQQSNKQLNKFITSNGRNIEILEVGRKTANEMFTSAIAGNKNTTWALRFIGLLLIFFGANLILKPLSVIADLVPIVGDIVGFGTSLVAGIISIVISLIIIALAWFVARPIMSVCLLLLVLVIVRVAYTWRHKQIKSSEVIK